MQDYKEEWDPTKFLSKKTGRGKLRSNWKDTSRPIMCCYKLVECEFKWFGLQGTVESRIQKVGGLPLLVVGMPLTSTIACLVPALASIDGFIVIL